MIKTTLSLLTLVFLLGCVLAQESNLALVVWHSEYTKDNDVIYSSIDTVNLNPKTGATEMIVRNFVHPFEHFYIYLGLSAIDAGNLYFVSNLEVNDNINSVKMIFGTDLKRQSMLPTIGFDVPFISSMSIDKKNKKLFISTSDKVPPYDANFGLWTYSLDTYKAEEVTEIKGYRQIAEIAVDSESQILYMLAINNKTEVIASYDIAQNKIINEGVTPTGGNCVFSVLPGMLFFNEGYGLSAVTVEINTKTQEIFYSYITFSMKGNDCVSNLILKGKDILVEQTAFDAKTGNLYLTLQDVVDNFIITFDTKSSTIVSKVAIQNLTGIPMELEVY